MPTTNFLSCSKPFFIKALIVTSVFLIPSFVVFADYPKQSLETMPGIQIKGNGSVVQLQPDGEHSKPIISWLDYDSGKQAAWLVTHDRQPDFEGSNRHRHFSIETSKAHMGWLTTRMEFPYGEDLIDIGIYDSNLKLSTGLFMYFNNEKTAGSVYDSEEQSLITFSPKNMGLKSKTGSFQFYADGSPKNRKESSEIKIYGSGDGDEFVRLAHNGQNAILQSKKGSLIIDQNYHTPVESSESCQPKAFAFDETYIYLCNDSGQWGRTQMEYGW